MQSSLAPSTDLGCGGRFLHRANGTTLGALFGEGSPIASVTVRHLLSMRSGIPDYDDAALRALTLSQPDTDYSPFDMLAAVNKTFLCTPGTCGASAAEAEL